MSMNEYLDYIRAELIKMRAEYVFSASLASSIFEYLKELRCAHESSGVILEKYAEIMKEGSESPKVDDKHYKIIYQIKKKVVNGENLIMDIANTIKEYEEWEANKNVIS